MRKLKNALSLTLALALSLVMAVPAFAADTSAPKTLTGNQLFTVGAWNNGPSLTLSGVVGEWELYPYENPTVRELVHCYDVTVGGSLVLEMPYPAGLGRTYSIMPVGVFFDRDRTAPLSDNDPLWDTLLDTWMQADEIFFDASSGKTQFVYNFTEADMGEVNGCEKYINMESIYWQDNNGAEGYVSFYLHVVPASGQSTEPSTPVQPTTPVVPEQPTTPAEGAADYVVSASNNQRLNVRKGPGTNYGYAAPALKNGTVIQIVETQDDWGKLANDAGWVYLPATTPVAEPAVPAEPEQPAGPELAEGEVAYTIKPGDSLSKIAKDVYGDVSAYKQIAERNPDVIKDVNKIYAGQVIVLPAKQ